MKSNHLLLILSVLSILVSCSIEKRLYTKGWNVQMHKKYHKGETEKLIDSINFAEQSDAIYDRHSDVKDDKQAFEGCSEERQTSSSPKYVNSKNTYESEIKAFKEIPSKELKSFKKVVKPYVEERLGAREDNGDYQPWLSILIAGGIVLLVGLLFVLINSSPNQSAEDVVLQIFALFFGFIILGIGFILLLIGLIGVLVVNFR